MSTVTVTGGAGFIGSHLVRKLVENGHTVKVLDNLSTGRLHNLRDIQDQIQFIRSDVRSSDGCKWACTDTEYVFHQAAIPSVPKSIERPYESHGTNIDGVFSMLMSAKECGVKRFIYAGSSSAYGDTEESPKHEGLKPMPLSPYAVQKYTGECYCKAFYECYGLQTISLRYFNVFGELQDPTSQYAAAIPAFITLLLNKQTPTIYGNGQQTRDFTYIANVVHGNMLAMEAKEVHGEVVNIACGGQITIDKVIDIICKILGVERKATYKTKRLGDIQHSCADISLAKSLLGYEPVVDFEEGMQRAIDHYKETASV